MSFYCPSPHVFICSLIHLEGGRKGIRKIKCTKINEVFHSQFGKHQRFSSLICLHIISRSIIYVQLCIFQLSSLFLWVEASSTICSISFGSVCCSGSTGKPKGVLHTTGGYLLYAATTFKYVFDYRPGDVYWCTADIGWITGHTYVVYGPLANGATSVLVRI